MPERVVSREAELAEGERFLDAVALGPSTLLLEGEVGIGKTTVWQEIVDSAARRGYRLLMCRPAANEMARLKL